MGPDDGIISPGEDAARPPEPTEPTKPEPTGGLEPSQIMPDASADELRAAIRALRDENKSKRKDMETLMERVNSLEGTAEERLNQLAKELEKQRANAERANFRAAAASMGIDPSVADLLDIKRFDLENPEKMKQQLAALNLRQADTLPPSGRKVTPSKPDDSGLKVEDLANLSPDEWDKQLADILKIKREEPYK
jgi:hypothetical protein